MGQNSGCTSSVYCRCVEVTDANLDVWNHTNNVCYIQWMQDVAVGHSAILGWDSQRYLDAGAIWVVRNHTIDYNRSTYKGNKLLVQTWIAEMKRVSCIRRYRFLQIPDDCDVEQVNRDFQFVSFERFEYPKSALIATAQTTWAFVSTENFKPVKVFAELNAVFEQRPDVNVKFPGYNG